MTKKILFLGQLEYGQTSQHRCEAMRSLGYEVDEINSLDYLAAGGKLAIYLRFRTMMGYQVHKMNRDLLQLAERSKPDLFWTEKSLALFPETIDALNEMGIKTVSFCPDNPFTPDRGREWRLFIKTIPHFDIHFVQRVCSIEDFKGVGAKTVFLLEPGFHPDIHFPPPETWSDADRECGVSFTGSPYDNRPAFLTQLWQEYGIVTDIRGNAWKGKLAPDAEAALFNGPGAMGAEYRHRLHRARINLSFVTHQNLDSIARRPFEITACRGFALIERSERLEASFEDGKEVVMFDTVHDCAEKIERYLNDEETRTAIANAGYARAMSSGYSNQERIARALEQIEGQ